jgi:hypothetical protein
MFLKNFIGTLLIMALVVSQLGEKNLGLSCTVILELQCNNLVYEMDVSTHHPTVKNGAQRIKNKM